MKVGEFFYALGIDVDDGKLDEFEKKLKDIKREMFVFGAAAIAAVYALDRFIDSSVRGAVALANFALVTGESATKLQQTQYAYGLSNIALTADETTSSIKGLKEAMTQIRLGGGNAAPFGFFGLDIQGKDAFQVLKELQAKKDKYEPAIFIQMAKQMGLSENFVAAMQTVTQADFDAAEKLVRPKHVLDALSRVGKEIKLLKENASLFKDDLVAKLEPVWDGLIKGFYEFGRIVGNIVEGITVLIKKFDGLSDSTKMWLEIIAVGTAVALAPLKAQMVALLLILEDIAVYAQGGQSLIGRAIDSLEPAFEKMGGWVMKYVVQPLRDVAEWYAKTFGGKTPTMDDLVKRVEEQKNPPKVGQIPYDPAFDVEQDMKSEGANSFPMREGELPNTPLPSDKDVQHFSPMKDKPDILDLYPEGYLTNPDSMARAIPEGAFSSRLGNSNKTENNSTFNNTFHIQGDNPQENGRSVVDSLHNQANRAQSQTNNSKVY